MAATLRAQRHVPLLDAGRGQGLDGREVLRQPDGSEDPGELSRAAHADHVEQDADGRVEPDGPADGADGHRQLDLADEIAVVRASPVASGRQAPVRAA